MFHGSILLQQHRQGHAASICCETIASSMTGRRLSSSCCSNTPRSSVARNETKKIKQDQTNCKKTIDILVNRIEDDQKHRDKLLEDHSMLETQMTDIKTDLESEKEKTKKTLKLAYLLRLEIAKQKTLISEQNVIIQNADTKIETVKSDMQAYVQSEVKDVRDELKKFQDIFLEQQRLLREMQEGTVKDVKITRESLHEVQSEVARLIELQTEHEKMLTEELHKLTIAPPPPPQPSSPSPPPSTRTPTPEPTPPREPTPEPVRPSFEVGSQVLARMPEEGNDGWFYRVTINQHNGNGKYRVECTEGLVDITEADIVRLTGIETELEKEDTVIASHPHYQATYAPGVIVKPCTHESKQYQVRFYDGTEGLIRKSETHQVEHDRFESVVDFILELEQRWINEKVIARDDHTGIYKLGTVKDRIGSGHEYMIEWTRPEKQKCSIQHLTCIFGQFSKRRILNKGDHVLAMADGNRLDYYPGIITNIANERLHIQFCNDTSTSNGNPTESFWISKEYYDLASEFIDVKADSFSDGSSTVTSVTMNSN